jgi:hypothetical protein
VVSHGARVSPLKIGGRQSQWSAASCGLRDLSHERRSAGTVWHCKLPTRVRAEVGCGEGRGACRGGCQGALCVTVSESAETVPCSP